MIQSSHVTKSDPDNCAPKGVEFGKELFIEGGRDKG